MFRVGARAPVPSVQFALLLPSIVGGRIGQASSPALKRSPCRNYCLLPFRLRLLHQRQLLAAMIF